MQQNSKLKKAIRLIFLIVLVNLIGYIASGYMTPDTMLWYDALPHSSLNPDNWVFSIVWSILLLLQAFSAFIVWGRACPRFFALQLALNMLWSFCFFYLRSPALALGVLILFLLALIENIRVFGRVSKLAGWLIVPTLLWGFFALYLNSVIVF